MKRLASSYGKGGIDAYSVTGAERKSKFLRDGCKFLKEVGKEMPGYTVDSVRANKGGMAVSGEVYAEYKPEDPNAKWIFVELTSSPVLGDGRRDDGVIVRAEWREAPVPRNVARRRQNGINTYHNANLDADALAESLLTIVNTRPF